MKTGHKERKGRPQEKVLPNLSEIGGKSQNYRQKCRGRHFEIGPIRVKREYLLSPWQQER